MGAVGVEKQLYANRFGEVLKLGLCFTFIFTAFQTSSSFQTPVLHDLGYGDLGFSSLALLYATHAVVLFFAPQVIHALGLRVSIVLGAICYCCFMGSLIYVVRPVFLIASALNGIGASLLWTSQGVLLTRYSGPSKRGRNSGIFWALLELSLLVGCIVSLEILPPSQHIESSTARTLYIALTASCIAGTLGLLTLRKPKLLEQSATEDQVLLAGDHQDDNKLSSTDVASPADNNAELRENTCRGCAPVKRSFKRLLVTVKWLGNRNLQLIILLTMYSGMELSFWQSKYPQVCKNEFGPHAVSIIQGVIGGAQIVGGVSAGWLSDRIGLTAVACVAAAAHILAYIGTYVNILSGWMAPSEVFMGVIAGFLGIGDAIINTLFYPILGRIFSKGETDPFALFFFFKSASTAIVSAYAGSFALLVQIIILLVFLSGGLATFIVVDCRTRGTSGSKVAGNEELTSDKI